MTLVLGYDDSPGAAAAFDAAARLAADLGDRLVAVYATAPPGSPGEEYAEHRAAVEELGRTLTADVVARAAALGVEASVELVAAKPAQALVDAADRHDARMVVVGSSGEGPLRGAMLGSTSYRVLAASERPVLVVRAAD